MQDFTEQAIKNGFKLLNYGECQFCGAKFQKGVFECVDQFNLISNYLDYNDPKSLILKFLSVDAHALQHPEIHGRWSNHFHLTRLYLILNNNIQWNYKKSPKLSNLIDYYKIYNQDERIIPPKFQNRGKLTSKDIILNKNSNDLYQLIFDWSVEVFKTWNNGHLIVSNIASIFMNKYK